MLKHESTTIDACVILTPTPIRIDFLVLPASAALLGVKVVAFVVQVDCALAAVTPDDILMRLF